MTTLWPVLCHNCGSDFPIGVPCGSYRGPSTKRPPAETVLSAGDSMGSWGSTHLNTHLDVLKHDYIPSFPVGVLTTRTTSTEPSRLPVQMCQQVLLVNRHRGCQHNVPLWHTGETFDCGRPDCALSSAHAHAETYPCKCNRTYTDYIRVSSLIQEKCDACKEAELGPYADRGRHY